MHDAHRQNVLGRPDATGPPARAVPEASPRFGTQHEVPRRWASFRVVGDTGDRNWGGELATVAEVMFFGSVSGGIIGLFNPLSWGRSAALFGLALELDRTDRWWTRITVGDAETTDGVVPGPSQVYPNAQFNYATPTAASHTAQTDSRKSAESIEFVLRQYVQGR